MAFSQGSQSKLSYIVESTYGTTPAGNFTELPFETHSLEVTKDVVEGNDIRGDRQYSVERHGNKQVGGDIAATLRNGSYDDLLESAMFDTWTSNVLNIGATSKSFTFEDAATDISQYRLYTGCIVNTFGLSIAPNQMVNATFGVLGKDGSISGSAKTLDAPTEADPFDSYSGTIGISNSGVATTPIGNVTALDFTVDNQLEPAFVIGSDSLAQVINNKAMVSGTMTIHYEDDDMVNRFLNETETALEVSVDDPSGSNAYTFFFPRIKINGAPSPIEGGGARFIQVPFKALKDDTAVTTLRITRPTP